MIRITCFLNEAPPSGRILGQSPPTPPGPQWVQLMGVWGSVAWKSLLSGWPLGQCPSQQPFPFARQLRPASVQRPQTPKPAGTVSKPTDEACVKPWLSMSVVLSASLSPSRPPGAQSCSSRRHFCSTNTHFSACPRRGASAQRRVADKTPSEDPGRSSGSKDQSASSGFRKHAVAHTGPPLPLGPRSSSAPRGWETLWRAHTALLGKQSQTGPDLN